jgi:hypothetical protein
VSCGTYLLDEPDFNRIERCSSWLGSRYATQLDQLECLRDATLAYLTQGRPVSPWRLLYSIPIFLFLLPHDIEVNYEVDYKDKTHYKKLLSLR